MPRHVSLGGAHTAKRERSYLVFENQLAEGQVPLFAGGGAAFPGLGFPMAQATRRGRLLLGDVGGMMMVRFPGRPRLDGIIDARTGINVHCDCVKLGSNPVPLALCVCSTFLPSGHWYVFAAVPSAHGFLSPSLVANGFLHYSSKRNPCHFRVSSVL